MPCLLLTAAFVGGAGWFAAYSSLNAWYEWLAFLGLLLLAVPVAVSGFVGLLAGLSPLFDERPSRVDPELASRLTEIRISNARVVQIIDTSWSQYDDDDEYFRVCLVAQISATELILLAGCGAEFDTLLLPERDGPEGSLLHPRIPDRISCNIVTRRSNNAVLSIDVDETSTEAARQVAMRLSKPHHVCGIFPGLLHDFVKAIDAFDHDMSAE